MKSEKFKLLSLRVFTFLFLFTSCNKNPFVHIELHGRIMHAASNTPLPAKIDLWTGGNPYSNGAHQFGSTTTNSDGTFSIKSNAGWNSDTYTLLISVNSATVNSSETKSFHVGKSESLDVGDILF